MTSVEAGMIPIEQQRAERAAQAALWKLSRHPLVVAAFTGLLAALGGLLAMSLVIMGSLADLRVGQAVQAEQLVRIEAVLSARLDTQAEHLSRIEGKQVAQAEQLDRIEAVLARMAK